LEQFEQEMAVPQGTIRSPALNVKIDNIVNSSKHFMYSTDRNPNWISTFSFITIEVLFYCIKRGGLSLKIHTFCIVMLNWHSF